jgi:hypothetical protein
MMILVHSNTGKGAMIRLGVFIIIIIIIMIRTSLGDNSALHCIPNCGLRIENIKQQQQQQQQQQD